MFVLNLILVIGVLATIVISTILGASGSKPKSGTGGFMRKISIRKSRKKPKKVDTEVADMGGEDADEWHVSSSSPRNGEMHRDQSQSRYDSGNATRSSVKREERKTPSNRTGYSSSHSSAPVVKTEKPKRIPEADFLKRYQEMASSDPSEFQEEFLTLPKPDESRCRVANMDQNKPKNRFKNILPYDDYRVKLTSHRTNSDYINASYMKGMLKGADEDRMFIATQGPLDHTIADFWQMVWENDSSIIVMLTNPIEKRKVKCARYWPDRGQTKDAEGIYLRNIEEKVEPFFVRRKIEIFMNGSSRQVTQYQFTSWDDKETLETAMPIWEVLDEIGLFFQQGGTIGPIVVNCSAGVGRTGTFIALAHLRSMMFHKSVIDVYNVVMDMRNRRMVMVQVQEQYQFIYESLVIWKVLKKTSFLVHSFKRDMKNWWRDVKNAQRSRAEKEFKLLEFICPAKNHSVTQAGNLRENWCKNRFQEIIPEDAFRPLLMTTPPYDPEPNNYVNASYHHSFQKKYAFIATQTPLRSTIGAFWSMVLDYEVASIVMIKDTYEHEIPKYWPDERFQQDYGPFRVGCESRKELQSNITLRELSISSPRNEKRIIRQFGINGMQSPDEISQSITMVVRHVQQWQRETGNHPIVVHCKDGIGLSGCFMAIYSAIDRLNAQHMIDVFTTVRRIRQTRPKVVDTLERYLMIYEALNVYLIQTEQSYSNFNDL